MFAVRWIHLLGMALALGGAALSWGALREPGVSDEAALAVATGYERAFWVAAGALVATGVGNLGSLAPYVPGADTEWGGVFAVKLLAVAALLVASLVRTLVVGRVRRRRVDADADSDSDAADESAASGTRTLRIGYALTAAWLAGLVALAEVLAHG